MSFLTADLRLKNVMNAQMQVPEASVRAFRGVVRILLVNDRLGVQAVLGSAQRAAFERNAISEFER